MTIGLVGRKAGMTRVFTDAGESLPVTVIEALPNRIVQVKDAKAGWLSRRPGHVRQPTRLPSHQAGGRSLRQAGCTAGRRS